MSSQLFPSASKKIKLREITRTNGSVTEVTNEFTWFGTVGAVLHDSKLQETNEGDNLEESGTGDGIRSDDGANSVGERVEGVTRVVNVSWKVDSGTGDDVSKEGQLGNTSVLDLNVTKTVETFFVSSVEQTEGIPETKRRLDTEFILESRSLQGGVGCLLGRGEGGGRSDEGGESKVLHFDFFV